MVDQGICLRLNSLILVTIDIILTKVIWVILLLHLQTFQKQSCVFFPCLGWYFYTLYFLSLGLYLLSLLLLLLLLSVDGGVKARGSHWGIQKIGLSICANNRRSWRLILWLILWVALYLQVVLVVWRGLWTEEGMNVKLYIWFIWFFK